MKLSKAWIIGLLFSLVITIAVGTLAIHITLAWWFNVTLPFIRIIDIKFITILINLVFFIFIRLIYSAYKNDVAYSEKVKIPLDKFEINDYNNLVTIIPKVNNIAYVFYKSRYRKLKVKDLKYIPMTNYYNIRRKLLSYGFNF